jgi:hypothetical protein
MEAETDTYPDGMDIAWIACDSLNQVGAFITAGIGPIPEQFLALAPMSLADVEGQVVFLPEISQANLLTTIPRPDDFLALAQRGCYVFDWTDIHRTTSEAMEMYELVATPSVALKTDNLPNELRRLAEATKFQTLDFADCTQVDPRLLTRCRSLSI